MGSAQSFKLMGLMFGVNFILSAFLFLKQNPLPSVKVVTQTVTEEEKTHPTRSVTTTETKTELVDAAAKPPTP
jgi:hypothetical protein